MTTSPYGDFTLYRRLARHTRSSWPSIAALFVVGLLATPLALLTPLPLKIAVDNVLGSRPLPHFLDVVVPAAITRTPMSLLLSVAACDSNPARPVVPAQQSHDDRDSPPTPQRRHHPIGWSGAGRGSAEQLRSHGDGSNRSL